MRSVGWNVLVLSFALLASARVPKKCPAPSEYPHTSLDKKFTSRQTFSDGDKVYYNCAEDFTPSRGSRAVQCVHGQWSKLSLKCEKRSCGNAGDLPNGQFIYEGNSLIGEKVYAVCNEGYTLKGLNYMICKKSVWTGDFPTCEEGETTCSTPAVANSVTSGGNVSVYRVGDNVTVTCGQGFQLDGAKQITCGSDGKWQPDPPRCLPSPEKTTEMLDSPGACGVPPADHNPNMNLADKYITMRTFASGDRVQYVCDVGYVSAGGRRSRTCKDGTWTRLPLKCERKLCGSAGEILNGQFMYTGVQFGDKATAVCDEGYVLVGQGTRNCMVDGWDGRVPECEDVVCGEPPKVPNAVIEGLHELPYTYRTAVRYRCLDGTIIGKREIWCTKDGTWSAPPPQCTEAACPSPNVANGFWRGPRNGKFQFRDTVSVECRQGYVLTGPRTITCGIYGQWLPELPKCRTRPHHVWRNPYTGRNRS
ncbi:C4b-binding protein alpha chain-like isoform X2 [Anabas testudineus]|uniref:C4b-binding protein alpha chain-like isoform X2 n=1 Tax=Anabas testudineus TaxID=64144 RepID=UPI000E457285|nr:C4b-binding protein alpha chain-like isoform X2 [Anabas testudineus]